MTDKLTRRDFMGGSALVAGALAAGELTYSLAAEADLKPLRAMDFGPCPRHLEDFLRYIVQRRTLEGLRGIVLSDSDPRRRRAQIGTVYNGSAEDMNIAWTSAAGYGYKWSRFHHDEAIRKHAFLLLDTVAKIRADGKWDDGGLDGFFGPQSLAWAVLSWIETGAVDAPRAAVWRQAVVNAADQGLVCDHYGPYRPSPMTGVYANPEMYLLSGLAAAWKLTGQERYRVEAGHILRRYDDWLFDGGGVAYFHACSPQHGYQQMAMKSVALYWDLTQDPYAYEFLKRLAPYFPNVQHRSGLLTDAEQPQLKHTFGNALNPGAAALLAAALGDGANRHCADVAAALMADNVNNLSPSFGKGDTGWYNYQAATYAASALRLMEKHPLPPPLAPPGRRVFMDNSFRGVRSHWDDFTAATGTRQMNDSLAGAYVADPREPLLPLESAVDGISFEVLQGAQTPTQPHQRPWKFNYACMEWSPIINYTTTEGFASISSLTKLRNLYWGELPLLAGENGAPSDIPDWGNVQHWAVWRDYLIGFGALRCYAGGGDPATQDTARVRWRLSPQGRILAVMEKSDSALRFQYGRLRADLACLDQKGGFSFRPEEITEAPRAPWTPLLTRPSPWSSGDFVHVSTVIHPADAEGSVQAKALPHGAAAVLLEPEGRNAFVWITNLDRHSRQFLLDVPSGAQVGTYKRNIDMPGVPPGEPANAGLNAAESALWVLQSDRPLDATALLAGLRENLSRRRG